MSTAHIYSLLSIIKFRYFIYWANNFQFVHCLFGIRNRALALVLCVIREVALLFIQPVDSPDAMKPTIPNTFSNSSRQKTGMTSFVYTYNVRYIAYHIPPITFNLRFDHWKLESRASSPNRCFSLCFTCICASVSW